MATRLVYRGGARDWTLFHEAGVAVPKQPANPPQHLLCTSDFMSFYNLTINGKVIPRCTRPHGLKSGLAKGIRLHVHELEAEYTGKYNIASAKFQVCYWLHDKPLVAKEGGGPPTLGSVADLFSQGGVAGRQGVEPVFSRPPPTRDKYPTALPSPPGWVPPTTVPPKSRTVPTPPITTRKPTQICLRINESLGTHHNTVARQADGTAASFTAEMDSQAALMLQATVTNSTELRYNSNWKHWEEFRKRYITSPPDTCLFLSNSSLTTKVRTLCAFTAFLHNHKSLRANTVNGALSSIRHAFRSSMNDIVAFEDPCLKAVRHTASVIDKKNGLSKKNRKLPFTLDMVQYLLGWSDLTNIHYQMCATAVQLAYFGLYRSSEFVHDATAEFHHEEHALRTSDVVFFVGAARQAVNYSDIASIEFTRIDSMRLTLRSAKNDQCRRGKKTFFTAKDFGPNTINMVRVMYDWAVRSKIPHGGILMSHWDTVKGGVSNLTYDNLANTIKRVAQLMGYDKSKYAAHSPRIGGASTLRACKVPDPTIQMMGKWDSAETPKTYEEDNVREFIESTSSPRLTRRSWTSVLKQSSPRPGKSTKLSTPQPRPLGHSYLHNNVPLTSPDLR
eukprot:gene24939-31338_t